MKVLVGIDGGPQQEPALKLADQLARGGELIVATVFPMSRTTAGLGEAYASAAEEAASSTLRAAGEQLGGRNVDARAIADLSPARALHALAEDERVDVLVIGACHRGAVGRALLGGTGQSVVHGSPCPVVVAPRDDAGDASEPRRIAVAYDGGAESDAALAWAERLAKDTGASLEILVVTTVLPVATYPGFAGYPSDTMVREFREEAAARLKGALDRVSDAVRADGRVLEGPTVKSLVDASEGMDLLVAGSRGYGPVGALLLGSVSRGLMHEASCPVVIVPRSAARDDVPVTAGGAMTAVE